MTVDTLTPTKRPFRADTRENHAEDLRMLQAGILDARSLKEGYTPRINPVEFRVASLVDDSAVLEPDTLCLDPSMYKEPVRRHDGTWGDAAFGGRRRIWKAIRRQHNLRTTMGRDQWQRVLMSGDVGSGSLNGLVMAYTGSTATSLTGASGLPTATSSAGNAGLQGKIILVPNATVANTVFGVCMSNSATSPVVDQWYAIPCTGAAGTTPTNAAGTAYVLPGSNWAAWVGLSTNSAAAAAGDVLRTADGLFGDGTTGGAATEQTANGLARTYIAATFPIAGQIQYQNTWTYTGASSVTLAKVVLCNSKAAAGSLLFLETLLSATATVTANGDTVQVTWQENL